MANPPFNVDKVKAESTSNAGRLPFGCPKENKNKEIGNANYLWISYFYAYLNEKGRAGSVSYTHLMTFGEFWKLYTEDVKNYVKLNTWLTKEHIVDTKILPYFRNLKMNEITPGDVRKWQNEMVAFRYENGKCYSQTYKKTMHNILSAIFNHACRFYNLKSNPARQAGNMGREEKKEMLFWTTEEYKKFSEAVIDKPVSFYAFEMLRCV